MVIFHSFFVCLPEGTSRYSVILPISGTQFTNRSNTNTRRMGAMKKDQGDGDFWTYRINGFTNYKSRDFPANMGFKTINFCGTILPAILLFVGIRWYWSTFAVLRTTDGLVLFWWCQQGLGIVNILCAEVVVSNLGNHKKRCALSKKMDSPKFEGLEVHLPLNTFKHTNFLKP